MSPAVERIWFFSNGVFVQVAPDITSGKHGRAGMVRVDQETSNLLRDILNDKATPVREVGGHVWGLTIYQAAHSPMSDAFEFIAVVTTGNSTDPNAKSERADFVLVRNFPDLVELLGKLGVPLVDATRSRPGEMWAASI